MSNLIKDALVTKPHLVILGAGASRASFLNGDKGGRLLPLMDDLIDTLELHDLFQSYNIQNKDKNFENLYGTLYEQGDFGNFLRDLEDRVYHYFDSLEIPDEPTLYDHLILSLGNKDRIATFNWDPFLWQAGKRCNKIKNGNIPNCMFLHGNVAIVTDHKTRNIYGKRENIGKNFETSKLLYPILTKDYSNDLFISSTWVALKDCMSKSYRLTIFGYSAPETDVEAIKLLKQGWGNNRDLEQIDFINTEPKDVISAKWDSFICSHHFDVFTSFYQTDLALFPGRTCEKLFAETMECKFINYPNKSPFLKLRDWDQIRDYFVDQVADF